MGQQQNKALKVIYTLVLALAYGLFIGITIYTFYPHPEYPKYDYKNDCSSKYDDGGYDYYDSSSYRKCINNQEADRDKQREDYEQQSKNWYTMVSVILLVLSTLSIAGSIFLNEKLEIISNGILLGSFFTLLASDALSFGSGNKFITFAFSLIALLVTIATGYIKLVVKKKQQDYYQENYSASPAANYQNMGQAQPVQSQPPVNPYAEQPSAVAPVNQPVSTPVPPIDSQEASYVAPIPPDTNAEEDQQG